MCDIIATVPWHCGFEDGCKVGWHKSNYWTAEDGYTVDSYSDGDHEYVDESDVPTPEKIEAAWDEYRKDVAKTGFDPLGEFSVTIGPKVKAQWQARFRSWLGQKEHGVAFVGARRRGRGEWLRAEALPLEVREYLLIVKMKTGGLWTCPDFKTPDELRHRLDEPGEDTATAMRKGGATEITVKFTVEEHKPVPEQRMVRMLKHAARERLKSE